MPGRKVEIDAKTAEIIIVVECRYPIDDYDKDDFESKLEALQEYGEAEIKSKTVVAGLKTDSR